MVYTSSRLPGKRALLVRGADDASESSVPGCATNEGRVSRSLVVPGAVQHRKSGSLHVDCTLDEVCALMI